MVAAVQAAGMPGGDGCSQGKFLVISGGLKPFPLRSIMISEDNCWLERIVALNCNDGALVDSLI
jgi:hypothetical protein